MDSS
ncbi:hypothetical protein E2C01_094637 [Portunus trituberculatus]|jgi:hypothetical protein